MIITIIITLIIIIIIIIIIIVTTEQKWLGEFTTAQSEDKEMATDVC